MKKYAVCALCFLFFILHIFLGFSFINSCAPTYDEPVHLASGFSYLKTEKFRMNINDHPPLAEMIAALPLLFKKISVFSGHPDFVSGRLYNYADLFLYKNTTDAENMMNSSRKFIFIICGFVLFGFMAWCSYAAGGVGAVCACSFFSALNPALLSNDALVTTDALPAILYFCTFVLLYQAFRQPDKTKRMLFFGLTGIATGLAMAGKFNMFVLPFFVTGLAIWENRRTKAVKTGNMLRLLMLYAACAFLSLAFVYKFSQIGLYWDGLYATLNRLDQGRSSFAYGNYSIQGVWWYFPLALLIKTPLSLLILPVFWLWSLRFPKSRNGMLFFIIPPAVYFLLVLTAKVQIGYRHILPVMPFIILMSGLAVSEIFKKGKMARISAVVLMLWYAGSVLRAHPYYLSYFNEITSGPAGGYKALTDSNLDWGQSVKQLAHYLKKQGNPAIYFSYFGSADPAYYGMKYILLAEVANVEMKGTGDDPSSEKKLYVAVSATNLQSTYYPEKDVFRLFKTLTPEFVAGYSIFLYNITDNKEAVRRTAEILNRTGMNEEALKLYARIGEK